MASLSQNTLSLLREKKVVILGAGLTGLSCARFLRKANISFTINDSRENPIKNLAKFSDKNPESKIVLGHWDWEEISQAGIILVSPGIDLTTKEFTKTINPNCLIWGDVEVYCRMSDTPILAVTGSNGKSTVVSLLAHLGQSLGFNVELGGNIGIPVLNHLVKTKKSATALDMLILELSSFQLESLSSMNAIASTILNVSDDHLDRHLTIENYQSIKHKIYQQSHIAIENRDDVRTHVNAIEGSSSNNAEIVISSFGTDTPTKGTFGLSQINSTTYLMFGEQQLIDVQKLPLAGIHNAMNCLAALALGYSAGWSLSDMVEHLASFQGLEHRCEKIETQDGVHWINDSKATNVGATLAAINGFSQLMNDSQRLFLIAGGDGKGADFSVLQSAISDNVFQLVTLGKDGGEIAKLHSNTIKVATLELSLIHI